MSLSRYPDPNNPFQTASLAPTERERELIETIRGLEDALRRAQDCDRAMPTGPISAQCILSGCQACPPGWKLVPAEPSEQMVAAGWKFIEAGNDSPADIYRAMLAAAPGRKS